MVKPACARRIAGGSAASSRRLSMPPLNSNSASGNCPASAVMTLRSTRAASSMLTLSGVAGVAIGVTVSTPSCTVAESPAASLRTPANGVSVPIIDPVCAMPNIAAASMPRPSSCAQASADDEITATPSPCAT